MTAYKVTAARGAKVWVLECAELGAVSQVARLDQVESEMLEALAYLSGKPEAEIEIEVVPVLPDSFREAMAEVEAGREAAKAANRRAAQSAQVAARVLLDYGLSLRDAGVVMGLSHQRVAQLVS